MTAPVQGGKDVVYSLDPVTELLVTGTDLRVEEGHEAAQIGGSGALHIDFEGRQLRLGSLER